MPVQIPFPIPSHGYALNSKMRINLEFLVEQFNEFNSGTATWDTVAIGTPNNLTGTLTFYNASNSNYLTFQAGATDSNTTITWPTGPIPDPFINFMTFTSGGVGTWRSLGSFGFASNNESYVTMALSSGLNNERVLTQGGGISISDGGANSTVTISNSGVTSITGTANQVIRDVATGVVTLSLPQSIATSSLVQFGTVRTTTTGDGTNPSIAVYDSNTGWYRTSNDLYQILSGSIVSQTFFADLSTRFPKVVTASMVLRDTAGTNPTVTLNPPSSFTSYAMTLPTSNSSGTQFLTNNGSGTLSWSTPSGTGADVGLDNLSGVAINTSLLPGTDNSIDLGSSSKNWRSLYVSTSIKNGSTTLATATELGYLTGVTSAIQTQFSGKASLALDNLSAVAINASLLPGTDNAIDLGSSSKEWKDFYIKGVVKVGSTTVLTPGTTQTTSNVNFNVTRSAASAHVDLLIQNTDNTSGTSDSRLLIQNGGTSGGDAVTVFTTGATSWGVGSDISDSNKFKISRTSGLGTNDCLTFDGSNNASLGGTLSVSGDITATGGSKNIYATTTGGSATVASIGTAGVSITVTNSKTLSINIGGYQKTFGIYGDSGDGCLVTTSYSNSTITILGPGGGAFVASASPSANQIGISKSVGDTIVIKSGSTAATNNPHIFILVFGSVTSVTDWV